jgi:DNA polymerase elongation subunit (family B)
MIFSLITTSYVLERGQTKICLFARDTFDRKVVFKIPFNPYFYVESTRGGAAEDKFERIYDQSLSHRVYTYNVMNLDKWKKAHPKEELVDYSTYIVGKSKYNTITDQPFADFGDNYVERENVHKLIVKQPWMVRSLRTIIEKETGLTYEADVLFHLRFLIDRDLYSGFIYEGGYVDVNDDIHPDDIKPIKSIANLKMNFIDIELLTRKTTELETFQAPINVIGWYNSYTKKYKQVHGDDEAELLKEFLTDCAQEQYDLYVTFSELDIKTILKRMEVNNIDSTPMCFIGKIKNAERGKIMGSETIDISRAYSNMVGDPMWLTLDYITEVELGIQKFKLTKTFYDSWFEDREALLKKNYEDVECMVKLEEKLGVIVNYLDVIRRTVGCNFEDTNTANRIGDTMYLRHCNGKVILRTRTPLILKGFKYKGAIVHDVEPGIYKNILIIDWSELYPNIIESLNIGWNTYIRDEASLTKAKDYTTVELPSGSVYFRKDIESWTVGTMKGLRSDRALIKERIQKAKEDGNKPLQRTLKYMSAAFKAIINAEYGAYGFAGGGEHGTSRPSRFYEPNIAEATTIAGRDVLTISMKAVESIDYKIIYGDTDSVFIEVKEGTNEESEMLVNTIITAVEKYVREKWNSKSFTLNLSVDKIFDSMLLIAKKRYHGITSTGEEEVKGLEIVRKDTAQITVDVEKEIGKMILTGSSKSDIESKIKEYYQLVMMGKAPLDKAMVRGKCSKEEYDNYINVLKAQIIGNELLDQDISFTERFYWIYLKGWRKADGSIITTWRTNDILVDKKEKKKTKVNDDSMYNITNVTNLFGETVQIKELKKKPSKKKHKSDVVQITLSGEYKPITAQFKLSVIGVKEPVLPSNAIINWNKMANRVIATPLKKYCSILGIDVETLKITKTL